MIKGKNTVVFLTLSLFSATAFTASAEPSNAMTHVELLRVSLGLLFVLFVIFLLSWVVRRMQGTSMVTSSGFQSIASMTLGPKEKIVLTKVGAQYLLIGVGAGSINLLYDFGTELPIGFDSNNKSTFAQILKSAVGKS